MRNCAYLRWLVAILYASFLPIHFKSVLRGKSLIWLIFPRAGWVSAHIKTTTIEQNSAATATLFDSLPFRVLSLKMQR